MPKETELCLGCMEKKTRQGTCPLCGYDENSAHIAAYLAPGTVLQGRYLIGRLICYNGESGLYMGYDMSEDRKITVREYMPEALCERKQGGSGISVYNDHLPLYKTYLSEFVELHRTLMTSDRSSSIQPVLSVFIDNGTAYAVMDYIDGITLKTYLSSSGEVLGWEQAKRLFAPILTTLGILHGKGIIHRGLSLNTLLVTEKNELKLISFGISASRTADSDIACEVYGGYAAPEQYSSARRNGSWTDIYGISAVLYRCLTGITPPSAQERLENDTLVEPMLINRSVPANVSKVIMKGLSLEVPERIGNVNEFVDRLFEQPQPVTDSSAEIHVPVRRPAASREVPPGRKAPARTAKKKKKKDNGAAKYIIVCSAMGVAIIIFLLAIIIPAATGGDKPEETEATTASSGYTATTPEETEPPVETSEDVSTPPVTTAAAEGYVLPDFKDRLFDSVSEDRRYSYLTIVPVYEFNNEFESGVIFDQDITPGTVIPSGATITLKVSKGAEKVPLPDYKDMTVEAYKALLGKLNIKYETEQEETDEVLEGYVVRCSVEVGTEIDVANGETVVVYTALTPSPTETEEETYPYFTDITDESSETEEDPFPIEEME